VPLTKPGCVCLPARIGAHGFEHTSKLEATTDTHYLPLQ
jgi:hypothetical protein